MPPPPNTLELKEKGNYFVYFGPKKTHSGRKCSSSDFLFLFFLWLNGLPPRKSTKYISNSAKGDVSSAYLLKTHNVRIITLCHQLPVKFV